MKNIFNFSRKNDLGEPPWEYSFLQNLDKKEYPKYLAKIFKYRTGEKLPLKYDFKTNALVIDKNKCKTFNQKIQWIKLYGVTDLMRNCTDKVKVRDYVEEKIGNEYLKLVLQICNSFDEIDFDKLPSNFVIKCNHGCKWHYIIKNKIEFLNNKKIFNAVKQQIQGWLEQDYWCWNGFEMNYRGIEHKLLIEPLMRDYINIPCNEIHVHCFSSNPEFLIFFDNIMHKKVFYDKELNIISDDELFTTNIADKDLNQLFVLSLKLSEKLSENFSFVRIDWMLFGTKLYFEELTFTPHSGFCPLKKDKEIGNLLNIGNLK